MLGTGRDVLPAIRTQHGLTDCVLFGRREGPLAQSHEVRGVRCRLTLQHVIETAEQRDQIVDRSVALVHNS